MGDKVIGCKPYRELYKILSEFLHEIKYACPHLIEASKYLRRRRDCPGAKEFDEGQKKITDAVVGCMNKLAESEDEIDGDS